MELAMACELPVNLLSANESADSGYRRTSWGKTANLQLTHSYSLLQMFMNFVSSKRVSLSLYLYVCIIFFFYIRFGLYPRI